MPYSIIGIQCVLLGDVLFPPIYWQAACLLQRSGALDGKGTDHNKVAKAVSEIAQQGVNILPIDINKSDEGFTLDAKENKIFFGLSAIKGMREKTVQSIMEQRPFSSMEDFLEKTKADITSTVTLLKAGGFDSFGDRIELTKKLGMLKADVKKRLNGQNLLGISKAEIWPQETPELVMSQRIFNFTQYLKKLVKTAKNIDTKLYYPLDDKAKTFLDEIEYPYEEDVLDKAMWKSYYDVSMKSIKAYLIENQEKTLTEFNNIVIQEWKEKYFGNECLAQGEIETMGICFAEHPLLINGQCSMFEELSQEPTIMTTFTTKTGRSIPLYNLTTISGIAIAKDSMHSTITLLTECGPVDVKYRKEQFAVYDKQVSIAKGGKKEIVEKGWFKRGTPLVVHGMRQDDTFMAKTYRNSPMRHTTYKITGKLPTGRYLVQEERKRGLLENGEN